MIAITYSYNNDILVNYNNILISYISPLGGIPLEIIANEFYYVGYIYIVDTHIYILINVNTLINILHL